MTNESDSANDSTSVDMPQPTAAPVVLALGIVLMAMGVATSLAFLFVGVIVFIAGLGIWISQWLPGRGHWRRIPRRCIASPAAHNRLRPPKSSDCATACQATACGCR